MQMIERNVRVPDRVLGDLQAPYAACQVGAKQLAKLYERQGSVEMDSYMREIIDYAERMTRARLSEWPDGRYSFRDHIDERSEERRVGTECLSTGRSRWTT